ncbi:hypothetical protein C2E23DRAFT_204020 [Lenzites betulinus]|nr:hypothetical protein C2E23DRAFT_204020 [Lenzites betulinus]
MTVRTARPPEREAPGHYSPPARVQSCAGPLILAALLRLGPTCPSTHPLARTFLTPFPSPSFPSPPLPSPGRAAPRSEARILKASNLAQTQAAPTHWQRTPQSKSKSKSARTPPPNPARSARDHLQPLARVQPCPQPKAKPSPISRSDPAWPPHPVRPCCVRAWCTAAHAEARAHARRKTRVRGPRAHMHHPRPYWSSRSAPPGGYPLSPVRAGSEILVLDPSAGLRCPPCVQTPKVLTGKV